jgi:CHAP domain
MNRRQAIVTALSAIAGLGPAFAQSPTPQDTLILGELPPLPPDLADKSAQPPAPYTETKWVGTQPPSQEEMGIARDLLIQSPFGVTPIDVAQYFLAVGAGAYGKEVRPFVREWPERANPMIFHFFSSTLTKPEGDTTAWCAAFMNWCLLRARAAASDEIGKSPGYFSLGGKPFSDENLRNHSTNNASSGSFRCWEDVSSPKRGDIAVFKNAGTDGLTAACRGQGHVTFFLSVPRAGWVRVLGGNQSDPGSGGAITVADMRTDAGSRFMKYVSPR